MTPEAFLPLSRYLNEQQRNGLFPGAAWAVISREGLLGEGFCGELAPGEKPVDASTLFDLASLTKPIATATSIFLLVQQKMLKFSTKVSRVFPELASRALGAATIHDLLTHTAGLPAWKPLYLLTDDPDRIVTTIGAVPLEAVPGSRVEYSCLGYILLGEVIRSLTRQSIGAFASRHLFQPLGMAATGFNPPKNIRHRAAPTERGNAFERSLAGDEISGNYSWRTHRLRGEVHDGNAWFLGGEAGNAGLFAPVGDVARFCRFILNEGCLGNRRIVESSIIRKSVRNQTAHLDTARGYGWLLARSTRFAGKRISPGSVGHTGFTGTSIWLDLERGAGVVLLTNRVFRGGDGGNFSSVRPVFMDLALEIFDGLR